MSDAFGRPERTAQCTRCHGHGVVSVPYALAPDSDPTRFLINTALIDGAFVDVIRAVVIGAYSIFEAVSEASDIAKRASRPVGFEFNGAYVEVYPDSDPVEVARSWWIRTYGKTSLISC